LRTFRLIGAPAHVLGNYEARTNLDIPLTEIINVALKAKVGALSFEAPTPDTSIEWVVFKEFHLPDGLAIIPGVIDSTTNFVEHPELVAQRIVRYAEVVGRENVIAGTDCGFGTFVRTEPTIDPRIAWAKLKSLAEGAAIASKRLWS